MRQLALLDQHGGDRAAALVQRGFDDHAGGAAVDHGLQLEHLGLQRDGIQQVVDALAGLGRQLDELRVATELLGHDLLLQQLVLDAVSGSASDLSILLTATISGTPAALACCTASMVCGMTPSSAATTSTTMSVSLAPRARIDENAAWPGVSRKLMTPLSVSTWYAPMCWVMPPASPVATLVRRM